jgi:hypothetical protein
VHGTTTVHATQDMVYGDAPLERYQGDTAGFDSGDLAQHGIYNTYFKEFSFNFNSPSQRAVATDTALNPGLTPTPSANGTMYYEAFTINTASLNTAYQVHFDLYSESLRNGTDLDVNNFAPFSHTASSMNMAAPEPASLVLLGTGLTALVARRRRKNNH